MDLSALITGFRVTTGDHGVPPLFADDSIAGWFSEAERQAARRAHLLFDDTTPAITQIALAVGQRIYRLHGKVYDVLRAAILPPDSNGVRKPLTRSSNATMQWTLDTRPGLSGWADAFDLQGDADGADARGLTLRLDRAPAAAGGVLYLATYRYPRFDLSDAGDEPEIALRHHDALADWALYRAYSTRDMETSAAQRAEVHKRRFIEYFGELPDANVLRQQQQHRPPVVRMRPFR